MSSPADRSSIRLVLLAADGQETVYDLEPGRAITLGRDPASTVVLQSHFVSKRHAILTWTGPAARLEDQDSANGVKVNGRTIQSATLSSGDVIQLGDQRLRFEAVAAEAVPATPPVPAAATTRPVGKGGRLLPVVVLALLLLGIGALLAVYVFLLTPAATDDGLRPAAADQALPVDTPIAAVDSAEARAVEQQALAARARPVDRLYEAGEVAYRSGRLLDAYRLLHGAVYRDAQHEPARRLLRRVMGERDGRLRGFEAAAARAEQDRKFEDAARQWEQVRELTLDSEPLHTRARTEVTRLQQRTAP